jgi:rhodanese-related sulfurtransferase
MTQPSSKSSFTRRAALLMAALASLPTIANAEEGAVTKIAPAQLAEELAHKDFVLINVHIPYQGEIEKTDAFIPYDSIAQSLDKLPHDRAARIVVYCKGGPMSAIAATELVKLGFTEVEDLAGGMDAWEASGHPLIGK